MADRFTLGWNGQRHKGMRLGTLWDRRFDPDGDVSLSTFFDEYDDIDKLDVLSDWIGLLKREYDATYRNCYKTEKATIISECMGHSPVDE